MEEIKQCTYYMTGRKCMNKKHCPEQAGVDNCMSYRYYAKDLELQLKRKEKECELLEKINKENQEKIKRQNELLAEENISKQYGDEGLFYELEDYKQALQDIKEIVTENIDTTQYSGICKSILQIISEIEE